MNSPRYWLNVRARSTASGPVAGGARLSRPSLLGRLSGSGLLGELQGIDALCLHLGFLGRLCDVDRDCDGHLGMQNHPLLVQAKRLDRALQHDLAPAHREPSLGDRLRDVAPSLRGSVRTTLAPRPDDGRRLVELAAGAARPVEAVTG